MTSVDKARAVIEQCTDLLDSSKDIEEVDPQSVADLYWNLFQKYEDNKVVLADLFNSLCHTLRIAPILSVHLSDHNALAAFYAHIQKFLALTEPKPEDLEGVAAITDVITALLDNDPDVNVPEFLEKNMHLTFQELLVKHKDDELAASCMHALSAAVTDESIHQICTSLSEVVTHLSVDRVYNHPVTTEAALALLRQISANRDVASTLDLKVLNLAVRAIRAHTSSFPIVDHAMAFLANMRGAYRDTLFPPGALSERDAPLTVIDAMQVHEDDPWITSAGFRFLMTLPPTDPSLLRIGLHHAKVMKSLMRHHQNVADVQVYGCLAVASIARANPLPMRKTGFTEQADKIHLLFPKDVFVRNCASYLTHAMTAESPEHFPVLSGVPPEWDFTAGGPGTLLKLEGNGETVYLGGTPEQVIGEHERVQALAQSMLRGYDAVDDDDANFSDDGESLPMLDVDQPTTDDEVPDLELIDDDKDCSRAIARTVDELTQLAHHPAVVRYGIHVTPELGEELTEMIREAPEVLRTYDEDLKGFTFEDLDDDAEVDFMESVVDPARHELSRVKAGIDALTGSSNVPRKWEEEALSTEELIRRDYVLQQDDYIGRLAKGLEEYALQVEEAAKLKEQENAKLKQEEEAKVTVEEVQAVEAKEESDIAAPPDATGTDNDANGQKPSA